jgi:hypothetical protein
LNNASVSIERAHADTRTPQLTHSTHKTYLNRKSSYWLGLPLRKAFIHARRVVRNAEPTWEVTSAFHTKLAADHARKVDL